MTPDQEAIDALAEITVKSRWSARRFIGAAPAVRVMAIVEGWVVARHNGCIPFVVHQNDWHARYIVRKE